MLRVLLRLHDDCQEKSPDRNFSSRGSLIGGVLLLSVKYTFKAFLNYFSSGMNAKPQPRTQCSDQRLMNSRKTRMTKLQVELSLSIQDEQPV